MKQTGQVILALILIMAVALAIGVSVVQKSLLDVTTATRVEQSQRAFSAAEAGIEKALRLGGLIPPITLDNQSSATVEGGDLLPCVPGTSGCAQASGTQQLALEYPPISKEEFAHVWLADPFSITDPPLPHYTQSSIDIYWGTQGIPIGSEDRPAIVIRVIYHTASGYQSQSFYLDSKSSRVSSNNFTDAQGSCTTPTTTTILGTNRSFLCRYTLSGLSPTLMLLRARILYSSSSQPFAVQALRISCPNDRSCSLPPQAKVITSIGVSGETQRKVQVLLVEKVVPPYFDFAIFSAGEIRKE